MSRFDSLRRVITGCDHIGIQVRDLERSVHFYEGALGFVCTSRFTKDEPYVQRVVGYHPDVILDIAMLAIPGTDVELEILRYRGVDGTPVDPAPANPGTAHFCLFVDDLGAIYERLSSDGVEFVSEPQTATAGPIAGQRLVYMKDPDGIRVELVEQRR
jgi:catechol 2,3-dioxygenase-like lactoylglutathione lyase family enzyme